MAQKKSTPVDPVQAYQTAIGYYFTGRHCFPEIHLEGGDRSLKRPGAVILCLASEIFIKALLHHRAAPRIPDTHDLRALFKQLSPADKAAVMALYATQYPERVFDTDLKTIKGYFDNELRYYYEYEHRTYDHNAPAQFADCLYRHTASVLGQQVQIDPFDKSETPNHGWV